jgi:hypothetical protein
MRPEYMKLFQGQAGGSQDKGRQMKQKRLNRLISGEKGQTLIMVMIMLLISSLIIAPMLSHVSSGLKTGKDVYEERMKLFYAADAGIEDALWYLQGETRMKQLDSDWEPDDTDWTVTYELTDDDPGDPYNPDDINNDQVDVTISYVWLLEGLNDPTPEVNEQVTVVGYFNTDDTTNYISDFITESADSNLNRIGVWLPYGYQYVDGSATINGVPIGQSASEYPYGPIRDRMQEILYLVKNPTQTPHRDGTALLWNYSGADFGDLSDLMPPPTGGGITPGEQYPPTIRLAFDFEYPAGVTEPEVFFPWIKIDASIAWDPGVGFYHIESVGTAPPLGGATEGKTASNSVYVSWGTPKYTTTGGGTSSSLQGDYIAIGNSLMTECWYRHWVGSHYHGYYVTEPGPPCNFHCDYNCRGTYFDDSYATVDGGAVPDDAQIKKAFLYWTAWWTTNGADEYITLKVNDTLITPTNGDGIAGTEDDDPGGVFRDRYSVLETSGSNGYQYSCFADVTAEVTGITSTVNGTKFTVGGVDAIPASSCDQSPLWLQATNAGWSMIIIYASAEKEAHQIYLYDQLSYLWDEDGATAEFTILGFEAPEEDRDAKLTIFASEGDDWIDPDYARFKGQQYASFYYLGDSSSHDPNYWQNVFNGYSSATGFTPEQLDGQGSGEISGVDIDTYTHTSTGTSLSSIVQPGDTQAKIRIQTVGYGHGCDGIMLNYVIFSVRSTLISGGEDFEVGTMSYEIN